MHKKVGSSTTGAPKFHGEGGGAVFLAPLHATPAPRHPPRLFKRLRHTYSYVLG
ncbi:hypothetical protein HanRHA438_Chr13g0588261 [Helianthus annuus]|nr:hypothetical protein HanRHA438_Chr13g0588261 [Helianthus annuus]